MAKNLFCSKCGAKLPDGASFCGNCGNKVSGGESDHGQHASVSEGPISAAESAQPAPEISSSPESSRKFKKLMPVIWAMIGVFALSCAFSFFDVCEYYAIGQFGDLLGSAILIVPFVCLAMGVAHRKNWARVTFIVLTGLISVGTVVNLCTGNFESMIVLVLRLLGSAAGLLSVVMLFNGEISQGFERCRGGKKKAALFWGVYLVAVVGCGVYASVYTSNNEDAMLQDCARAASKGSDAACETLAEYIVAQEPDREWTEDELSEKLSQCIEEVCGEESQTSRSLNKAERRAVGKGITKAFVKAGLPLLLVAIIGVVGWIKKQFGGKAD